MSEKKYVSERITNIKELEGLIEKSRLSILSLIKGMDDGTVTDIAEIRDLLIGIDANLEKAYTFEFCLERRMTVDK